MFPPNIRNCLMKSQEWGDLILDAKFLFFIVKRQGVP